MTVRSFQPTEGLSYDPAEERYWRRDLLDGEVARAFEICAGCRLCFKYCDAFPRLFSFVDRRHAGDATKVDAAETRRVMEACFQCKLCEVQCPYTPRDKHPFQLDFPKLVHRWRAVDRRAKGKTLRMRVLNDPDGAARLARLAPGLANAANRSRPLRILMEKAVGIHRDKLLPEFAAEPFDAWAEERGLVKEEPGGEVVLFQTCFVQHNDPQLGRDVVEVLERCGVDVRVARGLACCGMPAWEQGDLPSLRAQARRDLEILGPYVERGAKVVVVNPTCSMMLRREWPHLLEGPDRERAQRLAAAVMDAGEYVWSIRNEPRFSTDFRSVPPGGRIAYHAPCHLRTQGVGFKGRDLLRKIPGVEIAASVLECCGHDGTFAMTVEGFEPSARVGKKAFDAMKGAQASVWATDCPLAAIQFRQHAGRKPLHPLSILARAYRGDPFDDEGGGEAGEPGGGER